MNIFENARASANLPTDNFYSLSNPLNFARVSNKTIINEGFIGNQDVYSVVSRCARLCSNVPLMIMNGDNEVFEDDEFYNFFYEKWGKSSGVNEGLYSVFLNLFLFGRAYILKNEEAVGFVPTNQFVLPTQCVVPNVTTGGYFDEPESYTFYDGSKTHTYYPDDLTIIKYYDPTDVLNNNNGLSPLQATWKTVNAGNNRNEAESKLLENRGISGFISPKAANGDAGAIGFRGAVLTSLREIFSRLTGGASKFNKVEVLEMATEFTQLGLDANDLKLIEMRLNHVRDICNVYGVPSLLFNDYQSRTHANYREAMKALYTDFVIPQVKLFINQYEKHTVKIFNNLQIQKYWIQINESNIEPLNPSADELRAAALEQYSRGLITKSEAREMIGRSAEMEDEQLNIMDVLMRNQSVGSMLFNSLTEEEKNKLLTELGLK